MSDRKDSGVFSRVTVTTSDAPVFATKERFDWAEDVEEALQDIKLAPTQLATEDSAAHSTTSQQQETPSALSTDCAEMWQGDSGTTATQPPAESSHAEDYSEPSKTSPQPKIPKINTPFTLGSTAFEDNSLMKSRWASTTSSTSTPPRTPPSPKQLEPKVNTPFTQDTTSLENSGLMKSRGATDSIVAASTPPESAPTKPSEPEVKVKAPFENTGMMKSRWASAESTGDSSTTVAPKVSQSPKPAGRKAFRPKPSRHMISNASKNGETTLENGEHVKTTASKLPTPPPSRPSSQPSEPKMSLPFAKGNVKFEDSGMLKSRWAS